MFQIPTLCYATLQTSFNQKQLPILSQVLGFLETFSERILDGLKVSYQSISQGGCSQRLYNKNSYMRQRNIPVTQKVSAEAQTEINLVHDPVYYTTDEILSGSRIYTSLRQSHLVGPEGVIRPETDGLLLSHIRNELQLFRGLKSLEGISQADLKKRLQWLESQVEGLEKRSLNLLGTGGATTGYYTLVNDLQAKLDKQFVINNNYEPKIQAMSKRIEELEAEVAQLRKALLKEQQVRDENEALKEAFRQVSEVARDPKKMREFEKTVSTILNPLMEEVDVKLDAFIKSTTVVGRAATTPANRLKTQVNGLAKGLDRLLKSHEDFTVENIEGLVGTFLKDLDVYQTYENYSQGKLYKHLYEDLKDKFSAACGIYKSSAELIIKEHPELRSKINLAAMESLQTEGVEVMSFNNILVLEPGWGRGRTVYYQTQEARTKNLITLMGRQFKRLIAKYPAIKAELGAQLLEFLTIQVFDEAIALEEMERIVEVVKYQPEIVKVENVYQYNSDKNLKAIFHLRIMVKTLLEELLKLKEKTGAVLEIDEGLLGMIRAEILDLVDTQDVLRVFRSVPKILQVQRIVEKDLGRYLGVLTQAHPLNVQSAKVVDRIVEKPVMVKDQVSIIVEKGVPTPVIHEKAIYMTEERVIEVPVQKEVIVERLITNEKAVEVEVIQEVPIKQIEYQEIEKVVLQERVVEVPRDVTTNVPYETTKIIKEIVEIPRYEERLVEIMRDITNIKEVRLTQQVPMEIVKYIELERIINNFIKVPQIVEIKEQVPITITNTIEKPVDVIQTIEKIVITKEIEEKLIQVPVRHEVAIVQEVPVPYKEQVIVLTKGDREEVIVEVERIIEKPIIHEVLKLKEIEVEKAVPVWLREQKPVEIQVNVPYIQYEPEIITIQVEKMVPYREEVPVEVIREIPVPIVLEKEVIKQVRVMVEKIVEKLVEVPRVVEVEKIVEKIVVVPRVIENIVHVPQIIEKIVEREVEVLKIVEVEKTVPIYLTNQVKEIVREEVPYPVEKIVYQPVDKEKIVVMKETSEIIHAVEVERRIPVEVIIEKEVPVIVQKIVEKLITIHDVQIRDREVVVPYKQQEPIELIQERAVEVRKVIENIVQVPQIIEKQTILYETKTVPEIHTVYVEKPIEVEKEVVFTDVKNVIQKQIVYQEMIKEVLVKQIEKQEVLRPEPYIVEKVVYTNEIHEQGVQVRIEKGLPIKCDQLVEVSRPINYFAAKEVPRNVYRDKLVEVRTFVDQLKEVVVNGPEKIVSVSSIKQQPVQVTEQVVKYLNQQVQKRVFTEVPVKEEKISYVEVPGKTVIAHQTQQVRTTNTEPVYSEKIVERVILLPQILQILKHVHEISEIQSLGVAVGVDIDIHRRDYIAVGKNLRAGLEGLLVSLRGSGVKSAELKAQIALIEELIPLIEELVKFPTIVQVPKEVEKIVEKERVVVVPTKNQEAIDREIASTTLIEKLVGQLKRLRVLFKVDLELEDDIKNIFFAELRDIENMDIKLQQFTRVVLERFHSLGNWTSQHSLMLNSFLQERFLMAGIIRECNDNLEILKLDLEREEATTHKLNDVITKLNIHNITLKNTLEEMINSLGRISSTEAPEAAALRDTIDTIVVRGKSSLDSALSDPLRESRYLQSRIQTVTPDMEKLRAQFRLLEVELDSYRGGESKRNQYLMNELGQLRAENETLKGELARLRNMPLSAEKSTQEKRTLEQSRRIDDLNKQLRAQQEDFDRKLKRARDDFEKQIQVRVSESRVLEPGKEDDRLRTINRELEARIGELEEQLTTVNNEYEKMRFEVSKRDVELESRRKMLESGQYTSEFEALPTTFTQRAGTSGVQPATRQSQPQSQLRSSREAPQPPQRPEEQTKKSSKGGAYQSPDIRGSAKYYTPAEQLKFQSPELREVRTQQQPSEIASSSSRLSGQQLFSSQAKREHVKRNVTVRQLMNEGALNENISAVLIIKILEKLTEETSRGRYMQYTPDTIHILGFTPDHPEQVKIKLGDPINRSNQAQRMYLPPEVLRGEPATQKSCMFNLAVIWDEMLHGEPYFRNAEEIENLAYEYKVRNNRINPIFKNCLFDMFAKDPRRRLAFSEIKRRLSLQHLIAMDEEGK